MTDTTAPSGDTQIDLGQAPSLAEFLERTAATLNVLRGAPDGQVAQFNSLHLLLPPHRLAALKKFTNAEGGMDVCEYRTQFVVGDNPEELDALLRFLHDTFDMATAEHPAWTTHIAAMRIAYTSRLNQQENNYGFVGIIDWQTPVKATQTQGVIGEGEEPL